MENPRKVLIIGSGSAGLTAAIYAARADLKPLVISGYEEGGQLTLTTLVENFPGFSEGVLGPKLMSEMRLQAEKFGAEFLAAKAVSLSREGGSFSIGLDTGETLLGESVIIASGASPKFLGLPGERELIGRGVSTCATCDAFFYKGKRVAVIGGGDSACEEALHLSKFANEVFLIHRRDSLRASKIMQGRVFANEKIRPVWDSIVSSLNSEGKKLSSLTLENLKTKEKTNLAVDGVFLAIGHLPNTEAFKGVLEMDQNGFLKTDKDTQTTVPGVFAAGDVCDPIYKQAIVSAGEGAKAALRAQKFLEERQ